MYSRWYLSAMIFSGEEGAQEATPAILDHRTHDVRMDVTIPAPDRLVPGSQAIVYVTGPNAKAHLPILADARCMPFPEAWNSSTLRSLRPVEVTALQRGAEARGLAFPWSMPAGDGMRDVIDGLGKQIEPAFDLNRISPE